MLDLSPTKLIIVFVVVVVLLGPKRLPEVARQLGAGWRKVRELHLQFDRELRQSIPDLPSSQDIVRFARSPVTLLNQLADRHDEAPSQGSHERQGRQDLHGLQELHDGQDGDAGDDGGGSIRREVPALRALDIDDPNLN